MYLTAPHVITGTTHRPDIRVIDTQAKVPDVAGLCRLCETSISLAAWIARELQVTFDVDGIKGATRLLSKVPALTNYNSALITKLRWRRAPAELIDLVANPRAYHGDCVVLANGYTVYRTADGFMGSRVRGQEPDVVLSNVIFRTQEIIRNHLNRLYYRVTIQARDCKPVEAVLVAADFATSGTLHRAAMRAYGMAGLTAHIGVYNVPGFAWDEIHTAMDDMAPVHPEVQQYGISTELELELPNLVITNQGTQIQRQTKLLAPPTGTELYSGIQEHDVRDTTIDPFKRLWQTTNVQSAALCACISHMLSCILQDLFCKRRGQSALRRHLLLADPLESTWENAHDYFTKLISGSATPVSCIEPVVLRRYAPLGALPLPANLRAVPPKRIEHIVRGSEVSLIGLCTSEQALALSDMTCTSFVALPHALNTGQLPARSLTETLRRTMPAFLLRVLEGGWNYAYEQLFDAPVPTVATYHYIANLIGVQATDMLDKLVIPHYWEYTSNTLDYFFLALRHVLLAEHTKYTIIDYWPSEPEARTAAVYVTDKIVMIGQRLLAPINAYLQQRHKTKLSAATTDKELRKHGYSPEVKRVATAQGPQEFWCLHREIWDSRIMGDNTLTLIPAPSVPKLKLA
jgi:hypothetical protein